MALDDLFGHYGFKIVPIRVFDPQVIIDTGYLWDSDTIQQHLEDVICKIGKFPSFNNMRSMGLSTLISAISRFGGLTNFRQKLGYESHYRDSWRWNRQGRRSVSGTKGVYLDKKYWLARVSVAKKYVNIGRFFQKDEAIAAVKKAEAIVTSGADVETIMQDLSNLKSIFQRRHAKNTSGCAGVSCHRRAGRPDRWAAYITIDKKRKYIGEFKTMEEAVKARQNYDVQSKQKVGT